MAGRLMLAKIAAVIRDMNGTARSSEMARAILLAMREGCEEMDEAMLKQLAWMSDTPLGNQQRKAWVAENRARWQSMIDVMLGEAKA